MEITIDHQVLIVISTLCGLTFSIIGIIFALVAYTKVIAMEKSTHQVTYMPIDPKIDEENTAFMEKEWATQEEDLTKQKKLYKEDLEDVMPEFAPGDEDKKIYSF